MQYPQIFADQFPIIAKNPNATRSSALLIPMHGTIARQIEQFGYTTKSLLNKEYEYIGPYGSKNLDVAIFDGDKLVGAILFKGIRSEYNKNRNNYFENMRGESQLLIDGGVPVYQIIFIPTKVKHKDSKGIVGFEIPSEQASKDYANYINNGYMPKGLKLGVYYIDLDYETYTAHYSTRVVPGVESTLSEGINNFVKSLKEKHG